MLSTTKKMAEYQLKRPIKTMDLCPERKSGKPNEANTKWYIIDTQVRNHIFSQMLAKKPNLALSSAISNRMLRGAGAKFLEIQVNRDWETEMILKILTTHPQPPDQNSIK